MSMRRLLRPWALLAVAATLTACGDEQPTAAIDEPSASTLVESELPVLVADGEVQVSCGGPSGWSPSVMADGIDGVFTDAEMDAIFRGLLADPQLAPELELTFLSEGAEDTDWRVLAHDEAAVTLGLGQWTTEGPAGKALVMGLELEGDRWSWSGGGDCRLQPVLRPGNTWVELSAPKGGLDRAGTVVTVGVHERECTSARDPGPFLHEPALVETSESVTVYWTSTPPEGGQRCPGNPTLERTLKLEEPLGERKLLDGSTYPPRKVDEG